MKKHHIELLASAAFTAFLGVNMVGEVQAEDVLMRYPIGACPKGVGVTNYFSHDGKDYTCGSVTYGRHKGTDYAPIGGWGTACEVVAAAAGIVTYSVDGLYDGNSDSSINNPACRSDAGAKGLGNFIEIEHADGSRTTYAHMKKGSLTKQVGNKVECGDKLGIARSSGCSTGVHLHFDISTDWSGSNRFDPYAGQCGSKKSRWVSQGEYRGLPGASCQCKPNCSGKQCGDDGCGGSCGTCQAPLSCASNKCVCTPNCSGKQCGDDGCGGSCGTCQAPLSCASNQCACVPTEVSKHGTFYDIESGTLYDQASTALKTAEITQGCQTEPPMFCVNCYVARKDAAVFLGRALGLNLGACSNPFSDVTEQTVGKEACSYISQLKEKGMISGIGSNQFDPNGELTRAQAAAFLGRAFYSVDQYTNAAQTFSDVPNTHWAFTSVEALVRNCVTNGCEAGKFCPDAKITRGDFAVLLARAKEYIAKDNCIETKECITDSNCKSGMVCENNRCVECRSDEAAYCSANTLVECEQNKLVKTICPTGTACEASQCAAQTQCNDTDEASCTSDTVRKFCKNGIFASETCANLCDKGKCVDCVEGKSQAACLGTSQLRTCIGNQWVTTLCESGKQCSNAECKAITETEQCNESTADSCDGPNIKLCNHGKYTLVPCDTGICYEGKCVECANNGETSCDGNAVRRCINHQYQMMACDNNSICSHGVCIKPETCDNAMKPECDGLNVKSCAGGQLKVEKCDNLCADGQCVDCNDSFIQLCEGNQLKSCDNHTFKLIPCTDDKLCVGNACVDSAEADCQPETFTARCIGNSIMSCNENGKLTMTTCPSAQNCVDAKCVDKIIEENDNPAPSDDDNKPDDPGSDSDSSDKPDDETIDNPDDTDKTDDADIGDVEVSDRASSSCAVDSRHGSSWMIIGMMGLLAGLGLRRRRLMAKS